jgi:hypothetical protein
VRLDTERQGRHFARRVLRKLEKSGPDRCRADRPAQSSVVDAAIHKLMRRGSRSARAGFSRMLTDALGVRYFCGPADLAKFYERMEAEGRFGQR